MSLPNLVQQTTGRSRVLSLTGSLHKMSPRGQRSQQVGISKGELSRAKHKEKESYELRDTEK